MIWEDVKHAPYSDKENETVAAAKVSHMSAMAVIGDLLAELRRVNFSLYDTSYHLERAYCEGLGFSPEFGWPVGDHVPETMADSIIARLDE